MNDVWISAVIALIRGITFICDVIIYVPLHLLRRPQRKLRSSNRIKGRCTEDEDPSAPYRTVDSFTQLTTTPFPGCECLDDLFVRAVRLYGPRQCLGTRELIQEEDEVQPNGKIFRKAVFGDYHWETYDEVNTRVIHTGSGLVALDDGSRANVCIFAETRADWIVSILACFKANLPVVTLYATLGEDAIAHGIRETECSIIITSSDLLEKFKKILPELPKLKHLIYFEGIKKPKLEGFRADVQIHSFSSLQRLGASAGCLTKWESRKKATREDLALIMYTSGSTGMPKGVMISNSNLLCGMSGQCAMVPGLGPDDIYVGYLPLAHVLELSAEISCVSYGCRIGFSSPTTLSDQSTRIKRGCRGDVSVLRPTLMTTVPVIMDRLYKAVHEKVNEGGKFQKSLFNYAYEYKRSRYEGGYSTPLLDRIIFKKVRSLLGGRIRMMLSGGAPLSSETQRFMNICFCCPVGQGYGLTETCGAGTIQEVTDRSTGRVGAPLPCNEIKLVDWEEGKYCPSDAPCPRGEVWIGGGNIALGYYKNPEQTASDFHVINGQRWFSTGDIGKIESDGCLRIIDRKKDLVKLQAGEYISLSKVETILKLSPLVDNVCMYADSTKTFPVCLIVPNQKQVEALARRLDIPQIEWPNVCENPLIEQAVLKLVQEQAVKGKLEKFEIPERIKLVCEVWMPDTGLVTEAFKLRRKNIEAHYNTEIARMYA